VPIQIFIARPRFTEGGLPAIEVLPANHPPSPGFGVAGRPSRYYGAAGAIIRELKEGQFRHQFHGFAQIGPGGWRSEELAIIREIHVSFSVFAFISVIRG
jgi:hypothetical protein